MNLIPRILPFFLTILLSANTSKAQSPTDVASELFDVLVAKDYNTLPFYRLEFSKAEKLFLQTHQFDTLSVGTNKIYDAIDRGKVPALDAFMEKSFIDRIAPPTIDKIEINYHPGIKVPHSFPMTEKALVNSDSLLAQANIYFTNHNASYILRLSLIRFKEAYYLVNWKDYFPMMQQEIADVIPIPIGEKITTVFPSGNDLVWNPLTNQVIPFKEETYIDDIYALETCIGLEMDKLEWNMMLSYNGEKGRFCYLKGDKPFEKIKYKDVTHSNCDLRYLNNVWEINEFLFKDPKGRYYKIQLKSMSKDADSVEVNYSRLN